MFRNVGTYDLSPDAGAQDATGDWSLFGNVGTGLRLSISSAKIQHEVRYPFGLTDYISDSFAVESKTINPADSPEFSAFIARLSCFDGACPSRYTAGRVPVVLAHSVRRRSTTASPLSGSTRRMWR